MISQLRIVCRPEIAAGFALASVPVLEATSGPETIATLLDLLADSSVGVILMEETLHDRLPEDLRRRMARRPSPLVVPFPGPQWAAQPGAADSYIVDLLRQIVGYRVRVH